MQPEGTSSQAVQPSALEATVIESLNGLEILAALYAADLPYGVTTGDLSDEKVCALVIQGVERLGLSQVRSRAYQTSTVIDAPDWRKRYTQLYPDQEREQSAQALLDQVLASRMVAEAAETSAWVVADTHESVHESGSRVVYESALAYTPGWPKAVA